MEHFERKEYKFYVPIEYAGDLRDRVLRHMKHDPYCAKMPNTRYAVRSIYFDTPNLLFYFEKIDGNKLRKKLRVRVYNQFDQDATAFLEIKRKIDDTIFKERAKVNINETHKLLNGAQIRLNGDNGTPGRFDEIVLNRFIYLVKRLKLEPKALITYEREAFFDPTNPDLRITFDYNVRSYLDPTLDDFYREEDLRTFASPNFILEVKFSIALPLWVRQMLRDYQLHLQSISKYCNGVDSWRDMEPQTEP